MAKVGSTFDDILQLLGLLILFVFILVAAYFVSKWIGKTGMGINMGSNVTIIETYKISPTKYIQIIKIADKYIAIGVGKDSIEKLTDLEESEIVIRKKQFDAKDFSEIFSSIKNKIVKVDENEEKHSQEDKQDN